MSLCDVKAELTNAVKAEFDRVNLDDLSRWQSQDGGEKKKPTVAKVTISLVNNVVQALSSETLLSGEFSAPCWIGGPGPWPAEEVLPTRNGLLHLPSYLAGVKPYFIPPTPRFFCHHVAAFDFDESAPPPRNWLTFLDQLWPNDPESITALQEWCGYSLTTDVSQQKIGMLIGPPRSGKGTIINTITAMIGENNVCNPKMAALGESFGLQELIGKTAAIITDARITSRTEVDRVVESLLTISGADRQTIPRKYLTDWSGNISTKFTIVSNELPHLDDASGALPSRMLIFKLTESFLGREDVGLFDQRIRPELPGILLWAIVGWKQLRDRGRLIQPMSAQSLVRDMADLSSPIGAFLKDRCTVGPGKKVLTSVLFNEWRGWCESRGDRDCGNVAQLGRKLRAVIPSLDTREIRTEAGKPRHFIGLELADPIAGSVG